jgi:hypothetical protein
MMAAHKINRIRFGCAATMVLAAFIASTDVRAQQPSPGAIAMARQLIKAKSPDDLYSPIVFAMIEQTKNVFLQTNPALAKDINDVSDKMQQEYKTKSEELANEVAKRYASRFTEAELKDAVAFYSTPLGKKITTQEPEIIAESLAFARQWAQQLSEEILGKMRAEMKKRGHDL